MPLTLYTGAQDPPTQLHGKEVVICPCNMDTDCHVHIVYVRFLASLKL